MKTEVYSIVCDERIVGTGELCWNGDEEYCFKDVEEAKAFIDERLRSLGRKTDDNRIYDKDGNPTDQYIITKTITCKKKKVPEEGREATSANED